MTDAVLAWHYPRDEGRLYGYRTILFAASYASSPNLRRVRLSGDVSQFEMHAIGSERTVLAEPESPELADYAHDTFARIVAAEMLRYWDAPDPVVEWLSTGAPALFDDASEEGRRVVEENPEDPSKYAARALMWATAWPGRTGWSVFRVDDALVEVSRSPGGRELLAEMHVLGEDLIPAMLGWDMGQVDGDEV